VAVLAAGCAAGKGAASAPDGPTAAASPGAEDGALRIECDRARVVMPESHRSLITRFGDQPPARSELLTVEFNGVSVKTRESIVEVEFAGEDFSVVAEGGVRLFRQRGKITLEEGPYRTVILRNGQILRR
jgi:hypothetical protein